MRSFAQLSIFLSIAEMMVISATPSAAGLRIPSTSLPAIPSDYHVPTLALSDLQTPGLLQDSLRDGLMAISVKDSPSAATIESIRTTALRSICASGLEGSAVSSHLLTDGTRRTTLATASIGDVPVPLQHGEDDSLEALRDVVAGLAKEFTQALDRTGITDPTPLLRTKSGRSYSTFTEISKASHNLEHFHLYEKETCGHEPTKEVLPMHTDAGLFLVFVPGMDCKNESSPSDLFIEVDGVERRAVFPEHTFGVMFGTGAEHWLSQPSNNFKAARHAVRMRCGARRAWYGMMHLVPQDTILQDLPQRTFTDLRQSMAHSKDRTYQDKEDFASIGCGPGDATSRIERRHRLQMVEDPSACNNVTNFFCWMSCLPVPEPPANVADASLYCLDPKTLDTTQGDVAEAVSECTGRNGQPGAVHNDICEGRWLDSLDGVPHAEDAKRFQLSNQQNGSFDTKFCYGGTSMYMDGFHWLGDTCVIYLFSGWVVRTSGALIGACLGSILFAMALEGVIRMRRYVVNALPKRTWKRLVMSATFYGLQLTMGYMIMLIVMTYSGPLFLSVILGLMGGHVVFNADQVRSDPNDVQPNSSKESATASYGSTEEILCCENGSNDNRVPEGCTPCCQNTL